MNIKIIINEEINNFSPYEKESNNYSIDNDFNLYLNDKKIYSPDSKKDLINYLNKNNPHLINQLNLNNDDLINNTNTAYPNLITLYRGHGYNEGNNYYSRQIKHIQKYSFLIYPYLFRDFVETIIEFP